VSDGKSSGTFTCARFTKSLGNEALFQSHPDHDLFGSLPGAKKMLAPRLLGAIGSDPSRYTSFQVLQSFAGTAPISFERGVEHGFRSCAHGGGRRMSRAEAARKVPGKPMWKAWQMSCALTVIYCWMKHRRPTKISAP
jgi:Transposase IS116/IS110/IS902 family